jgi:hypothetical protein
MIGENQDLEARFVLSNVQEKNFLDDYAYHIFEPTLKFEIHGRDAFKTIGLDDGIDNVVIFPFMESALRTTRRMIADVDKNSNKKDYDYWFMGTGYGLQVSMQGNLLQISLNVNPDFGPVKGNISIQYPIRLGELSLKAWVNCIVALSKELNNLAVRVNPRLDRVLAKQDKETSVLERWIESI